MVRIAMYVDGWNFYWSLVGAGIKPYGWCNFPLLAKQQTFVADAEVAVKYFTSADRPHSEKIADRQKPIWWRALRFIGCQILEGEFRGTEAEVEEQVGFSGKTWREKQTDIKLACHMIADCSRVELGEKPGELLWTPGYDLAVLLTQDTDFIPLVNTVSQAPFGRLVTVLLPPSGSAAQENARREWDKQALGQKVRIKQLQVTDLASALLPRIVAGPGGETVACHPTWMCREDYEVRCALRAKAQPVSTHSANRPKRPSGPGKRYQ
jgi:hypothetical protein